MLIGYARVSTLDQNPEMQTEALKAAGCERIIEEKASGAKRERPQLVLVLDMLREGDVLVVWKLDRLARSVGHLVEILDSLARRGVGFRCITQQIDTTSAHGRFFAHIFGAFAEFERSLILERCEAGRKRAKEKGVKFGKPFKLTRTMVNGARARWRDGHGDASLSEIAGEFGVAPSTLWRAIQNTKQFPEAA